MTISNFIREVHWHRTIDGSINYWWPPKILILFSILYNTSSWSLPNEFPWALERQFKTMD